MYSGFINGSNSGDDSVVEVNSAWLKQEPHWELIETLLQGTFGFRQKGRKYLLQEPREQELSYENRLRRSTLAPYYVRLERMLAGMLTRKPVRLNDVSDIVREQLFDVDLEGNDINVWTYETARKMLRYGHVGVLVDAPTAGTNGRPYYVTYTPREILGFRTELVDGAQKLTQLRLLEKVIEPKGEYGEEEVEQVRVLTPGAFQLHRINQKGKYEVYDEGTTSLTEIPFSVAYANRVNYMESRPPMEDIAELNLKSYQVQSDLDNQLHISSVPMLAIYGFPASAEEITAGPGEALSLPTEARAEYIEPGGNAYDAQFRRLEQIEKQINDLGLAAVLGQKLSAETAEAKRIDRSQGDSTMMVVAQQMQDMIDNCLRFHAAYLQLAEIGSCFVNRDFLAARLEPNEIQSLLQLYTAGTISQETLLSQLEAGEVLGDEFDIAEELEATQQGSMLQMPPERPLRQVSDSLAALSAEPEDIGSETI